MRSRSLPPVRRRFLIHFEWLESGRTTVSSRPFFDDSVGFKLDELQCRLDCLDYRSDRSHLPCELVGIFEDSLEPPLSLFVLGNISANSDRPERFAGLVGRNSFSATGRKTTDINMDSRRNHNRLAEWGWISRLVRAVQLLGSITGESPQHSISKLGGAVIYIYSSFTTYKHEFTEERLQNPT